ncbi:MAG: hypothetical protein V7722_06655, partial [Porticoccus sp.]
MRIYIVGGLPEPVGGVTNFLYRFSSRYKDQLGRVLDLYPAENKWSVAGLDCIVRPNSKFLSIFWMAYQMFRCDSGIVYFNFSSPRSLLLLLLLPKLKGVSWALTLHHGELAESVKEAPVLFQKLSNIALKRVDRIGFISEKQYAFYKDSSVNDGRLYNISTYLPYVDDSPAT